MIPVIQMVQNTSNIIGKFVGMYVVVVRAKVVKNSRRFFGIQVLNNLFCHGLNLRHARLYTVWRQQSLIGESSRGVGAVRCVYRRRNNCLYGLPEQYGVLQPSLI